MTKPNDTQVWFDAVIDLLIANGNKLVEGKRWSWDKEGGHCLLTRPIDFQLVKSNFEIPNDVILHEKYQRIATLQEYLDIGQRVPWQIVQVVQSNDKSNLSLPKWRPLLLQKGANESSLPVAEIEIELKKIGATLAGHSLKLDGYVEPYKNNYQNHTWILKSANGRVIGVFIQDTYAGITTFQNEDGQNDITELVALFKPLAKKLGLRIWNDQDLVDVVI